MAENPLTEIASLGQSLWLDYISRDLIAGGRLKRLIEEDGVRGMTSNPAIFEKAIAETHAYDLEIRTHAHEGKGAFEIYDMLSRKDVAAAADAFLDLYKATNGADGYVSLEVNPHLARDTDATVKEARRLWAALNRPNVLIKVPATVEGLPAIRRLISEGISVNVTLIFGLERYRQVAEAYLLGLEDLAARGGPLKPTASVASFFVSRIDVMMDALLDEAADILPGRAMLAQRAHGLIGIASAKLAYRAYKEIFGAERFKRLAAQGARPQRLLWASTGTKNPAESDVKYVEALIGPDTVDTAPLETIDAFRDHGRPDLRLEPGTAGAASLFESLPDLEIDIDKVAQKLEDEGIVKFNQPFDKLIAAVEKRSKS